MSGTSLDGIDLVAAEFGQINDKWKFNIVGTETIVYSREWINKLEQSPTLSGLELIELHNDFGNFIGIQVIRFIKAKNFTPDLISSHGHTVFHQPEKGITFQIGNGANIAANTKIKTIADFRSQDIALGGQGAPLVPIGDRLLFSEYDYCLNLGGFSNISFEKNLKRVAFDICPVNIILNYFAEKQGFAFDRNGELGRKGKVNTKLLRELNQIKYYLKKPPKSLAREWLMEVFMPVIDNSEIDEKDKLRTIYEHISLQIADVVKDGGKGKEKMLITGGGAFNKFLIELLLSKTSLELVVPSKELINFKEALIFALLGFLKLNGQINCLSSVTGASHDHCSGVIFNP